MRYYFCLNHNNEKSLSVQPNESRQVLLYLNEPSLGTNYVASLSKYKVRLSPFLLSSEQLMFQKKHLMKCFTRFASANSKADMQVKSLGLVSGPFCEQYLSIYYRNCRRLQLKILGRNKATHESCSVAPRMRDHYSRRLMSTFGQCVIRALHQNTNAHLSCPQTLTLLLEIKLTLLLKSLQHTIFKS